MPQFVVYILWAAGVLIFLAVLLALLSRHGLI